MFLLKDWKGDYIDFRELLPQKPNMDDLALAELEKSLPHKFGQVFDGWSNGGVHFIATFATFDRG